MTTRTVLNAGNIIASAKEKLTKEEQAAVKSEMEHLCELPLTIATPAALMFFQVTFPGVEVRNFAQCPKGHTRKTR